MLMRRITWPTWPEASGASQASTADGTAGLARLGQIADVLLRRQGGCTGCSMQSSCGTCMPLVQLYRKASAPLAAYCQHKEPGKEAAR